MSYQHVNEKDKNEDDAFVIINDNDEKEDLHIESDHLLAKELSNINNTNNNNNNNNNVIENENENEEMNENNQEEQEQEQNKQATKLTEEEIKEIINSGINVQDLINNNANLDMNIVKKILLEMNDNYHTLVNDIIITQDINNISIPSVNNHTTNNDKNENENVNEPSEDDEEDEETKKMKAFMDKFKKPKKKY